MGEQVGRLTGAQESRMHRFLIALTVMVSGCGVQITPDFEAQSLVEDSPTVAAIDFVGIRLTYTALQ